ncbi:MAG: ribose 5-phosphate isomerase B [Acidobacteria bacterium]|nr:ribose 5-phosphate isomerase B [Acidobacteriota bacterium]MBI3427108.1 ribose 5-phosphate isomerase B [Acidobacteriota bacterium]
MNREDIQQLVRAALTEQIGGQAPPVAADVIDESVKHVITESDVLDLPNGGKLLVRADAIITPAAQDVLRERAIEIRYRAQSSRADKQRIIALGADHGGYEMKEALKTFLAELGYSTRDFGTHSTEAVDYPDLAHAVARAVADGVCDVGIIVDGAGIGSCMAANKVPDVRAALCYDEVSARNSREHNYANVLTLGGKLQTPEQLRAIVQAWLNTPEGEARHGKRVAKIMAIEKQYLR